MVECDFLGEPWGGKVFLNTHGRRWFYFLHFKKEFLKIRRLTAVQKYEMPYTISDNCIPSIAHTGETEVSKRNYKTHSSYRDFDTHHPVFSSTCPGDLEESFPLPLFLPQSPFLRGERCGAKLLAAVCFTTSCIYYNVTGKHFITPAAVCISQSIASPSAQLRASIKIAPTY